MASPKLAESKKKNKQQKNSLLKGNFPEQSSIYPKPKILRINSFIAFLLSLSIVLSMISYLGVVAKEHKIKDLHSVTNKINYENIELQNKVDYLKSFYSIDNKVQKIDFLKKADKVMEVSKKNKYPVIEYSKKEFTVPCVPGY